MYSLAIRVFLDRKWKKKLEISPLLRNEIQNFNAWKIKDALKDAWKDALKDAQKNRILLGIYN